MLRVNPSMHCHSAGTRSRKHPRRHSNHHDTDPGGCGGSSGMQILGSQLAEIS
ncbi:hypothetical protein TcasGA2_TC031045 [Tribolium castaneum]|uniref:Uncharacterized protein n=1 Tax=Tribolium castaneum TaxID=7070 RepID=A0A139WL31_TRICA|nr:hypothetical protein TcasGA2_TC031045 [Tribolium castaneum]